MHHSRSLHDCFSQYMLEQSLTAKNNGVLRWKTYWLKRWEKEIEWYLAQDWHLMEAVHNSKDPFAGSHGCYDSPLTFNLAMDAVRAGHNLAVVMKDLVVVDVDNADFVARDIWKERTRTAKTPKGWHFYCSGPFDKDLSKRLRGAYQDVDTARSYPFFALVPCSTSFVFKKGERQPGPARVYEWVSEKPLMEFPDFAKEALA